MVNKDVLTSVRLDSGARLFKLVADGFLVSRRLSEFFVGEGRKAEDFPAGQFWEFRAAFRSFQILAIFSASSRRYSFSILAFWNPSAT